MNSEHMKCEYCGVDDVTVMLTVDPYDSEIDGDYTEHYICSKCYENRADDI